MNTEDRLRAQIDHAFAALGDGWELEEQMRQLYKECLNAALGYAKRDSEIVLFKTQLKRLKSEMSADESLGYMRAPLFEEYVEEELLQVQLIVCREPSYKMGDFDTECMRFK